MINTFGIGVAISIRRLNSQTSDMTMIKKTLLLLIALTFLAANASWAGSSNVFGLSICGIQGAVFDDAEEGKKKEGETEGEEEPDCE